MTHWVGEADDARYSQGQYRIEASLGAATTVDAIHITWPDGTVQDVTDVPIDHRLAITEGQASA